MSRKQKKMLWRILLSATLLVLAACLPLNGIVRLAAFLLPYLIIGWDVLWKSVRNILHGQIFDENFLMALATIGALILQDYPEAVFVMLFYQVGELFQSIAVGKSRKSIASLMDIRPDYANVEQDGQLISVDPEEVAVGDSIWVKPGEKIPLDGTVLEGSSALNTVALTGESIPRDVSSGDSVISGCINLNGLLKVQVTKTFGESTVSKILELVENSSSRKAKAENFITRFARYYTPGVVLAAVCLAVLPPLFSLGGWPMWIRRALTFLVISCPCALVISVPLAFFGGIGAASRCGILVKGGNYLEALSKSELVVFDKTGTLTRGTFSVTEIHPVQCTQEELLRMAALAESFSDHPISLSLKAAWNNNESAIVTDVEELTGLGIRSNVDGNSIAVGNDRLMEHLGINPGVCATPGTVIHVAENSEYRGFFVIADTVKPDAQETIQKLKKQGIHRPVMLTGDRKSVGDAVGRQLGLDEVRAELLPSDKVEQVEQLLSTLPANGKLVFVGDGINDAPVLSRADIGIAMGALGSDAAIEAADVVLMDDRPSRIPLAIEISKRTQRIVIQNILLALGVKGIVLLLGAIGYASMWAAVFADVGVAVLAILNSMRTLRAKFTE